ncbi:MAG: SDR family oxidoreductase [Cytophagaceae bacterium]
MNISLKGKRVIVGGSTSGIGKAAALALANAGAEVILIARNESKLKATLKKLDNSFNQLHNYLLADYSQPEELRKTIIEFVKQYGGAHILINNTGGPAPGKAIDAEPEEYLMALNSHLICNQILAQALVPYMKNEGYGRIINVISTSVKEPIPGLGVSNSTRAAVAAWAKTLSSELAEFGITVNNVLPGLTKTPRLESLINNRAQKEGKGIELIEQELLKTIPAGRFAQAEETAAAIVFLASEYAAYINGVSLPVDGGKTNSI